MFDWGRSCGGISVALAVLLVGCSGARRGKLVDWDRVPQSEVVLDRALTSEVDGLRVLWNGRVFGSDFKQRGFIAGSRSQFVALWKRVEAPAREPTVDFSKYVVLAVVRGGGKCPIEVLAVELHPPNVLRPWTLQASYSCQDVMVRRALVLAVPRRLLGSSVIFVERGAFKFSVPKPGEAAETRKAQIGRALSVPAGDSVEIPDRGKISLRTLPGGSQIWVAHQRDGSLNVLASTFRPEDPFHEDLAPFTWWSSAYSKERGRFFEGNDARGRSVHGLSPLQAYSWTRVDESHIRLGVAIPTEPGPIQAPDAAPVLEGPDYAYKDLPVEQWESVADGQVARVDIDLVAGNRRPAELCSAPDRSSPVDDFTECPAGSPTVEGSSSSLPHHIGSGPQLFMKSPVNWGGRAQSGLLAPHRKPNTWASRFDTATTTIAPVLRGPSGELMLC